LPIAELDTVFLFEFVDATTGIQELLLPGKERVTYGADLDAQVRFNRTGLKAVAASASYVGDVVLRMNVLFHLVHLFLP
jgi:hypothetical protein